MWIHEWVSPDVLVKFLIEERKDWKRKEYWSIYIKRGISFIDTITLGLEDKVSDTSFYLISEGHRYLFCILFTGCLLSQLSSQILKLVNQPMVALAFGRSMVFWCVTSRHWNEAMMEISFIVGMKSQNLNSRYITITEDDNLKDSAISHYCCRFLWWHLDVQFLTVFHITPTSSNFENSLIYSAIFGNFYC